MKLYRLKDECMATDILKRHGFVCATPDIGLVSEQIWQKDGKQYKFTGWENTPKTALMAENPKYIEVEQVQMTTKYKCKRCGKVVAIKIPNCPECSSCDGYDEVKPKHWLDPYIEEQNEQRETMAVVCSPYYPAEIQEIVETETD